MITLRTRWDDVMATWPEGRDASDIALLKAMFYLGAAAAVDVVEDGCAAGDPDVRLAALADEIQLEADEFNALIATGSRNPQEPHDAS